MRRLRLREWRERRALTQRDLAGQAGVTTASINRIENGVHEARLSTVRKLADALGVSVDELIDWEAGEPNPGKEAAAA